jgi:hypothetical protein
MGPEAIVIDLGEDLAVGSLLVFVVCADMSELEALVIFSKSMI